MAARRRAQRKVQELAAVTILQTDMEDEALKKDCIEAAREAFKTNPKVEKDVATFIKRTLDEKHRGTTWHCIVGKQYAASIAHATKQLIFFTINGHNIMLFQSDTD